MHDELTTEGKQAVQNMHQAFLEALRHREQEILRYLAILGPALGGFIWLLTLDLSSKAHMPTVFAAGSLALSDADLATRLAAWRAAQTASVAEAVEDNA